MQIKILGCGPSYGMPSLTRGFGSCDPKNIRNIRTRSSILLTDGNTQILFDTPPEIRQQLLTCKNKHLDGLCFTHLHYDHTAGAEDVKKLIQDQRTTLNIYGAKQDIGYLTKYQKYIFKHDYLKPNTIKYGIPFKIKHLTLLPIKQYHDQIFSTGYRIGNFAYTTDFKSFDKKYLNQLRGLDTWILGGISHDQNKKHVTMDEALELIYELKPKKTILTHIGLHFDYDELCKKLPKNIRPAYDGMIVKIKT